MATNYNLAASDPAVPYTSASIARGNGVQVISKLLEIKGKGALDTFTLCALPAGAAVLAVTASVIESAGETCTIDVGLQSGTTTVGQTMLVAFNANQAAGTTTAGAGTDLIQGSDIQQAISTNTLTSAAYIGALLASGSTFAAGKVVIAVTVLHPR